MKATNIIWLENKQSLESIEIPAILMYKNEEIKEYIEVCSENKCSSFELQGNEDDCLKVVIDAVDHELLTTEYDKVYIYNEDTTPKLKVLTLSEASEELIKYPKLFSQLYNEICEKENRKQVKIKGSVTIPKDMSLMEFDILFNKFLEQNKFKFVGSCYLD